MKMYRYLLFDLDGTLTDPGVGITNSVMYALKKFGIIENDRTALYKFIGPPLKDSFADFFGFDGEQCELAVKYYREYFKDTGIFENIVYDGIADLLKQLKESGRTLIVATSKPEVFAVRILKHFGLYDHFDHVAGAAMDDSRNRKADIIKYALEQCGVSSLSDAVMIGDRKHDIMGAKENGLDSIGVLYGYGDEDELREAGATFIAEKPADILKYI
ncbi:MAG: HAD family hydrolase [Ruminiclostridium sp.]|nr:HAD family hydrolase [Ruminiclostridium sp.]